MVHSPFLLLHRYYKHILQFIQSVIIVEKRAKELRESLKTKRVGMNMLSGYALINQKL